MSKLNTGGASSTPTIAKTAVDNLRKGSVPVSQSSVGEPEYVEVPDQPKPDMSNLMDDVELSGDQTISSPTPQDLNKPQEAVKSIALDKDEEGNYGFEAFGEETRYDWSPNAEQVGNPRDLNARVNSIVDNFVEGRSYFGTTPAPEGAPARVIPQALSQMGVTDAEIPNFLAVASVVTEKALHEAMVSSDKEAIDYLNESMGIYSKTESMEPKQVKPEASFTKNSLSFKLGKMIGEQYQAYKTGGTESKSTMGDTEALAIGDAMLEMYAASVPEVVERGLADVEGIKKTTVFRVTAHGADILNKDAKLRNKYLPKDLLKARKNPDAVSIKVTGELDYKGGRLITEALRNLGSIGNAVIPRRGKILLMTLIPSLLGKGDLMTKVSSEINNMGPSKIKELNARANVKGIRYTGEYVASSMNSIKDTAANALFGIASERRGANYLDYYVTAFNNRIAPLQTLLDPTSFKSVRFTLANPKPGIVKMNSRQERNYRQMIAMHLVPDGDTALPMERERLLKANHKTLYSYGKRLRDLVDEMDNDTYESVMDSVENLSPLSDPVFQKVKGLGLDPESDLELIKLIIAKGEDGMMYIDGLIDYANYYDALYNPSTRGRTPVFATYFNAYMDGKTNGLAANALILGIKKLAYSTGILRESKTDLLDNGDIRDDVERTFDNMITDHDFQLDEDTNIALREIAKSIVNDRQLHKDSTMTYGYGIDPIAFSMYLDQSIQGRIANGDANLQVLFEQVENKLASLDIRSPLSSSTAMLINTIYEGAVVNSLSPEMLESRKLMKAVALNHGFTDTLFQIDGPIGGLMKLSFGGKIMQDYDDASKIRYSKYEEDYETGLVDRSSATAVKYDVDRVSSAAPKVNFMGEEILGLKGANGAVVGAVQAVDSATLIRLLTGKSWKRLMAASGNSPYLHTIHDAIKVDVNTYDVVLDEVNKIWAETAMNYNYVKQASNALSKNSDKFQEDISKLPSNSKVSIGIGSKYQMVGYALKPVEKESKTGKLYTVYPNLERYLKLAGIDKGEVRSLAWNIVKSIGIKEGQTEISPSQLKLFIKEFNNKIKLDSRLSTLESNIDKNKKQLYPMIAKQSNKGKWIATADDILQYYSH